MYQFAENEETMIELLSRYCTVSVETMKIVKQMGCTKLWKSLGTNVTNL
jgi:hypothetical protein